MTIDAVLSAADTRGRRRRRRVVFIFLAAALAAVAGGLLNAAFARGATFVVDSTADAVDIKIGDGVCATSAGTCTVRAAVQETNALDGADTIRVPAGIYEIAIPPLNDNGAETGDFDVTDSLTITGAGAFSAILDGGWPLPGSPPEQHGLDRLLEIHPTAGDVTISGLTLREGFAAEEGGAIQNWSPHRLRLENVRVLDNFAAKAGGGINNADLRQYAWPSGSSPTTIPIPGGRVEIVGSTLTGNGAGGGGAAVNNVSSGSVSLLAGSVVSDNPGPVIPDPLDPGNVILKDPSDYPLGPSAIANEAEFDAVGTIRIADSTVSGNVATHDGAGVLNAGAGNLVIERSTITGNRTAANGGGIYDAGGKVTVTASTISGNHAANGGAVYGAGGLSDAGLRGRFDVKDSKVSGNTAAASGAGIYSDGDGQLTVTDVTFSGNQAGDEGGGLINRGRSSLTVTRGTFSANKAVGNGGGLATHSEREARIDAVVFTGNVAGTTVPDELGVLVPGDGAGGGLWTDGGPVTVTGSSFQSNTATNDGGGVSTHNHGIVRIADSIVRGNAAVCEECSGGGLENSGMRVTFERLTVSGNTATADGGGIHNSSSGEFTLLDSTVEGNTAENGGGFANASDSTLVVRRSLFLNNRAKLGPRDDSGLPPVDSGLGGGVYSISDGDSLIENSTLSGNVAKTGGGGIFHDADGELRLVHLTIWRNSAPKGGGVGVVESDFVPTVPPQPNVSVILRNTIVAGSLAGGSCDWYVSSEGGNVDGGTTCFLSVSGNSDPNPAQLGVRDRRGNPALDAIADNGGPTRTHTPRWGSLAIDVTSTPCVETDQRGVSRPQNGRCDSGAVEFEGPPPPSDGAPPDTSYISGPIQDTLETVAFQFSGTDDLTPAAELEYECRLVENDLTEAPEPTAPWEPLDPTLVFSGCLPGWRVPLVEEGLFTFEVRAIDRAGNVDPTPAVHTFSGLDTSPPDTVIADKPPSVSNSRAATFTFSGTDNLTPPQFFEYECRIDSRDPELWLECLNPTSFANLTTGSHTVEVRAIDGNENIDPTPARYTWTVGQPANCDQANITLTAAADAWVDEVNPAENFLFDQELTVRSAASGDPAAGEPVIGENARALVRFGVPGDAPQCRLESATLRLHSDSSTAGRTLEAVPLAGPWKESQVTWSNQPGTRTGTPATTSSGDGYREWEVTSHVQAMLDGVPDHGWLIRDVAETDPDGGDQSFLSRELPQDPPEQTLPVLVLRYEADGGPPPPPPDEPTGPATVVHCGQVLTQSTLVANDLTDCPGEGLVIGAPNIMVDLGGHTIDGPDYLLENASGQEEGFPAGIRNSGHTNVVIRNGTVQQFGWGVLLTAGTTRNIVENLTVLRNAVAGIELFDADDGRNGNTIRKNTINDNELGVQLVAGSDNSVVLDNTINGNLGEAVLIQFSDGHRIEGNKVTGIPSDPLLDSDGGVLLEGASNNVLVDNTIHDTGDAGVVIHQGSHGNRVERNVLYRNGDAGVAIQDSDRNQVVDTVAHQESDGGVVLNNANDTVLRGNDLRFNPSGVESANSNGLVVEDNDASDSLQAGLAIGNGVGIRILNNVANSTGSTGISVEGGVFDAAGNPVGGALIQGNTANGNDGDGISVADGGHTIKANAAHNNAGWGIDAGELPAAGGHNLDGGANLASGNERPEQCAGVVCATGDSVPVVPPDTTAPVTIITGSPNNPTSSDSASFIFTATDGPDGAPATAMVFECRLDAPPDPVEPAEPPELEPPHPNDPPDVDTPPDGEGWAECISPTHYRDLEPGEHHFEVRALDPSDNRDLTPATYHWAIEPGADEGDPELDSVAPDTRIAAAPADPTSAVSATFRFAGSDNATPGTNLRFQCRLDSELESGFADCTSPKTYADLAVGEHTFDVRAIDRSGNADLTPASHTWVVESPPADTTPPDTTIGSGPDPATVSTTATFTFTTSEPGATLECSLDGATFDLCTSPKEYAELTVRQHEFRVRAKDAAGNADPTPAAYVWTVGPAPVPTQVFCGQVLTRSTLVRNDLGDCLWDGLVIGAEGITIDLDGHTIDGKGLGAGIRNDGFDSVTVRNGQVADFDYGVMLNTGTARNIVESLTLERNQEAGIALGQAPPPDPLDPNAPQDPPPGGQSAVVGNTVRSNTVIANDLGIWLANETRDTLVRGNTLGANGQQGISIERSSKNRVEANEIHSSGGVGVALRGANGNAVVDNNLTDNGGGILIGVTETGTVGLASSDNRVERNVIMDSGGDALEIAESNSNQLIDNVAHRTNGSGIALDRARDTLVRGNDVRSNKSGIQLKSSSGNRLESNDASESEGTGITLEALSLSNVLLKNTSSDNDGSGIYVGDETPAGSGVLIEQNTANNNKDYGIFVPKVSHTIKGNIANDNGNWGIWASEGSNGRVNIDGGGNRALGNLGPLDSLTLKPQQCFTIRCDAGPAQSDRIPPDTSILEGPPAVTANDVAAFYFTGSDNASTVEFQCRFDEAAYGPCVSPVERELAVGSHTFDVRAVDSSGNVDPTPARHAWSIESRPAGVAPVTTIDSGPDLSTVSMDAKFTFSADERGSTFDCALDGSDFAPCGLLSEGPSVTYTGLAVGAHEFRVRATDLEGNVGAAAVWSWRIESAPVPAAVACGEILTRSTLVQNDLINCPGHGLIIGAPNITLDLGGHIIDGVGADAGILNNGFDSVTVTNGTVHEFDFGVALTPGTAFNVLASLRLELNQEAGIALSDADEAGNGNTIRGNTAVSNGFGIAAFSGTKNAVLRDNALVANTGDGVHLEHSNGIRVESNKISSSGGAGVLMEGGGSNTVASNTLSTNTGGGVAIGAEELPSNGNRVERNTIKEGGGTGIAVTDSTGTQVVGNVVQGLTGPGVALDLARNSQVRGNDLRFNGGGIALSESSNNRLESNDASGTLGSGIEIGTLSLNNDVVKNAASGNIGDGIQVEDTAPVDQGNLLDRNTADSNGGDGIAVNGVGHTLSANSVQLNGGWGIYAAAGATDGGGNYAAGNVEPGQCFGIVCALGTVPGAPDTWIVEGPADSSNSRNATITYLGADDVTPLHQLVFECRLDSQDPLAWEDCEYPAEYLNLSPGQHTLEVRAVDLNLMADPTPAKHTWTYVPLPAGVAPGTVIDVKPEAETWVLDALFTFHANEPDVSLECRVDTLPYEPCGFEGAAYMARGAFEWSFEETEAGLHTFSVRAIDFEGNVGAPATYTWRLLGVTTVFLSGPGFTPATGGPGGDPATGGETTSTTATIDFLANVADATYECSLDLAPFQPCTAPVTYTGLGVGSHELRVMATDSEGISQAEPAVYEWEIVDSVDVTPPDTVIERAPASASSSTIFEFTGTDDITPPAMLTYECRVDSTNELDWEACASPFNLLDLYTYEDFQMAPGQHTFEVRAVDTAEPTDPNLDGNVDPTPASYTWTSVADTTPPGTAILSGPAAKTGDVDTEFAFSGSDNATPGLRLTFECAVDAAAFEPCGSPESVQGLEPGEHTFHVRAVDLAGNPDPTPATRTWTIVAPPVTTIASGPASPSTSESAVFVFSADQAGSTFECALNGAEFVPCTSPQAYWIVANGTHAFEVRATNPELVREEPSARYEWSVELGADTTPPSSSITSAPPDWSPDTVATFEFTGSDNRTAAADLTFECALDGTAYSSCTSPEQFSDLTRGEHQLLIRARDAAGNFDRTPAIHQWTVAPPPLTTILSGPADTAEETTSRTATFTFSADVPGSTFQCWLDGRLESCTSPKTYTGLSVGDHYFAVLATSPAGAVELEWVEYEWTILPPTATIDSAPASTTENTSATFEFSTTDPDATFQCSVDGGPFGSCSSPKTYERLWPGPHRFQVQAIYPNMAELGITPVPATYDWTIIDTEPPDTTIQYGPPAITASTDAFLGFSSSDPAAIVECSLDGQPFGECEPPVAEYTELPLGPHTFQARAVDLAGNADPTPAVYDWTITEPPAQNTPVGSNVTVDITTADGATTGTVTFFEVTVAGATWMDSLGGAPSLPSGYTPAGGRFYDVSTTAEYSEPATVCLSYDAASFPSSAVRLLELDGSVWIDITTTNNPSAGQVCGVAEAFTTFAVASASSGVNPLASIISGPPNPSTSGTATFTFQADQPDTIVQCSIDGEPFAMCTSPMTYTHLDSGDHNFQVQAINASGHAQLVPTLYEWEIILPPDTTPPDTQITKGPPSLVGTYAAEFFFTGSDDQTAALELEFQCALDGQQLGSCSSPYEAEVLSAGEHTFEVRAIDVTGNVDPTPATRTWTVVDLIAPDTVIGQGPNSETEATTATFDFTAEPVDPETTLDPNTTFECSLDNADFTACTSPHVVEGLTVGPHVLQVRARDGAGNVDTTPDYYEWTRLGPLDTVPPDTVIASGPPPANSGPDVIFGFSSNEPVEEFECSLDGGAFEACESVHELLDLASGAHTLQVRAVDVAGNVDPTPAGYQWTTVGEPGTTILSGPADPTDAKSATFTFSTDQDGATFQCSVDGSPFVGCTSPFVAGPLIEDTHQFEVRAVNQFLNIDGEQVVDLTPAHYEWTIRDTTPPDTMISSVTFLGPTDLTEPNSWKVEFTGSDNRTSEFELAFECALDGVWSGCDSPHYVLAEELTGGEHRFQVRARDDIGNVDPSPASHTWTTEAPSETTMVSGPAAQTDSSQAAFTFTSGRAGDTFECSLDLAPFAACQSGVTYQDVAYGEHEFAVRAKGPAGSVDQTPATHTWESGYLTAPVATIAAGPEATTGSTDATFTFTANDADAVFQCSLDGAVPTFCTSPKEYTGLRPGVTHTFEVQATKPHLLVEPEPANWEWAITDDAPPETVITRQPADPSAETVVFEFGGSDNGTPAADLAFECKLNSEPFSSCSSPYERQGLSAGEHTLQVRAVDQALNPDATPASYTWTVVASPHTTITGPESPSASAEATFSFTDQPGSSYQCALDSVDGVAGFEPCTSPRTYTGLADGDHRFRVRATNSLGTVEEPSAEYAWTVAVPDTTDPDTTFDLRPPTTTVNTTATFVFAGPDNRTPTADLRFECALDGAAFADCPRVYEVVNVAVGAHALQVRATDLAGNVDETPAAYTWTVTELGNPNTPTGADVTIETTTPGGVATATVTFAAVTAGGVTAAATLDGGPPLPEGYAEAGALFYDLSTTAQFTQPVTVCLSYDQAVFDEAVRLLRFDGGVWTDVTVSIDETAGRVCGAVDGLSAFAVASASPALSPQTAILAGPDSTTVSTEATFTFSASDPSSQFECALDGPSWGSCSNPVTYTVAVGSHELLVRAKDELGNIDLTPARYRWTVEPLPETTIVSGPADPTGSTEATFTFTSDQPGVTFECRLDTAGYAACTSPVTYQGLAFEEHDFFVRAKDAAGNVDPTPAEFQWEIADVTAPETTIGSGPSGTTTSTSAAFTFSASEAGSTFECSLDGAAFAACTSPRTYTGLATGAHEFRVQAKDAAGNTDGSPSSRSWTIAPNCSTITATADRDGWVLQSSATNNYGTDSTLKVSSKSGDDARALVRFALPAIPSGCQVTSAKLRLYSPSYKEGRTLNALRLTGSWTESGVTWNNQPSSTTTGSASAASRTSAGHVEWTVTSQVQSMYSGSNNGFLIRDSVEGGGGLEQSFHSKEKGTDRPPQLVITFG